MDFAKQQNRDNAPNIAALHVLCFVAAAVIKYDCASTAQQLNRCN